jgi:hypothetical protein
MLIFVQRSSGRSLSWRRADTGIKSVRLLVDGKLGDADGIRDHLYRSAEIESADDDSAAAIMHQHTVLLPDLTPPFTLTVY